MRIFPILRFGLWLLLASSWAGSAKAMTVNAPTFPELVAESTSIVRAQVIEIAPRKVAGKRGELIKTFVTFRVSSALKGTNGGQDITLSFLGGQVGDASMDVPGMPTFSVGAEDYLFVTAKGGICPLVGAMHGRYRLITPQKEGRRYVAREDHAPLVQVSDVVKPMRPPLNSATANDVSSALTPEEFEKLIVAEVTQPSRAERQP